MHHMTKYSPAKTGEYLQEDTYSPIFKTTLVAKNSWRIINTIASIWHENMLGHLSLDIICSSKLTVFELRSWKTVRFSKQITSMDKYASIGQLETIVYITRVRMRLENPWRPLNFWRPISRPWKYLKLVFGPWKSLIFIEQCQKITLVSLRLNES